MQLSAVELAVQKVHDPSVWQNVPGLHSLEQFVSKYPSLQAKKTPQNIINNTGDRIFQDRYLNWYSSNEKKW